MFSTTLKYFVEKFFSSDGGKQAANKLNITRSLDTTRTLVSNIMDELNKSEDVLKYIMTSNNPNNKTAMALYAKYIKNIKSSAGRDDSRIYLNSALLALRIIEKDLMYIDDKFNDIFKDLTDPEDMKVSHAYVLGYLHLSDKLVSFVTNMLYLIDISTKSTKYKYVEKDVEKDVLIVSEFVTNLFSRKVPASVSNDIKIIKSGKQSAGNVLLMIDGKSLGEYVSESDYEIMVSSTLAQGITNPFFWLGTAIISYQHTKYENQKKKSEWIKAKISMLHMNMSNVDENSEDYLRQQKILNAYERMISDLDQKISKYEEE